MADTELIDHTGRVVFRGTQKPPGGGSQTVVAVRKAIAFDTPDLVLTGIELGYTAAVGDRIIGAAVSIPTTAWNGATPKIYIYMQGADPINAGNQMFGGWALNATDTVFGLHATTAVAESVSFTFGLTAAVPIMAMVDDNSGGDPGSTQGEGEIVLWVVKAM